MKSPILLVQVIPIYGRGGDNTDPRKKTCVSPEEEEAEGPVPRRPAGQRPIPIQVNPETEKKQI